MVQYSTKERLEAQEDEGMAPNPGKLAELPKLWHTRGGGHRSKDCRCRTQAVDFCLF